TGPQIAVGDTANFEYVVTNTGDTALGNVTVTDDQGVEVTFQGGDTNNNNLLDTDETWTYTGSTTVTEGQYTNIGSVTGNPVDENGNPLTDIDGNDLPDVTDNDPSNHIGVVPASGLGDFVFEDTNANGIQDSGEQGIDGVEVKLLADNDNDGEIDDLVATAITGDDPNTLEIEQGYYEFTGLTPGDYKVMFTQPTGFDGVSPFQEGDNTTVDSDAGPGLISDVVNLEPGEFDQTIDAGFFNDAPEPNIIDGTSGMDMITGTPDRDIITGFEGMDMITGGGGNDDFVYTSTWDQLDYVQDFQTGSDRLVFTDLLQNGTDFSGGDPLAQGYLISTEYGPYGTLIQVDPDGSAGPGFAENMVFLTGVSSSNDNAFNPTTDLLI
ncbi:MAG: hypothetical protein F6K23_23050, partial [Okeania sp. SIO2C9]|uniref:SdrD B-like domain-containing protein n=1 Tax=Okeania sp. SIO2C9 TaxID=2607791 RepID=UPI0013C1DA42